MIHEIDLSSRPPSNAEKPVRWYFYYQGRLLVSEDPGLPLLPETLSLDIPGSLQSTSLFVGYLRNQPCYAVSLDDPGDVPDGFYLEEPRRLLGQLDDLEFSMASRASQVVSWYRNHQFCSRCGNQARKTDTTMSMVCENCGYTQYPRITPCVIVLVTRGDQALLAHAARFSRGFYSCLAGFMEAGETAEQTVHREVYEETGLYLKNLSYFGSQSWPFPHALMLGFKAEHESGAIRVDGDEILDAGWWQCGDLPKIPPQGSIARALIDDWVARCGSACY